MAQGTNFPGFIGTVGGNDDGANLGRNFCDMAFYQKLGEGSSINSKQTSMHGGSIASSVGSNSDSRTSMLGHPGLKGPVIVGSYSVGHSIFRPGRVSHALSEDALAHALMDNKFPTETLRDYGEWTIDLGNLHMGMAFAQGAFGKLYRGTYNGMDVAIKLLERPEADPEKAQLLEQQFVQEVMMLATLRHPNIVKFIGACRKPLVWCIVTEYAKGGSLKNFLSKRQNRSVPLKLAVKQALDVARGMAYVHGLGFIHRDLKSDNLLISGDKSIKIADFGVARIEVKTEGMTPETGTYRWMAPEMIQHRPYNQKVDVYSFAIVLWELVTGNLPFANMTAVQAAFAVANKGVRPAIPHDCLPALVEIMTRCWDANPEVRPPFTEIVRMLEQVEMEALSMLCCKIEKSNSDAFKRHLARVADILWIGEDGMKVQVCAGQLWDVAFAVQAILACNIAEEYRSILKKAHDFIKASQILDKPSGDLSRKYCHISKGGWGLQVADQGWQVSDCTAEALKVLLMLSKFSSDIGSDQMETCRLYDAVNVLLSLQNPNGGYGTWELARTYPWMEIFNMTEIYADIMVEHQYVECTSSVMQALALVQEKYPWHRKDEIDQCITGAIEFIEKLQNDDGLWFGSWGICFTYGTWFAIEGLLAVGQSYGNNTCIRKACKFLLTKQLKNGGWGESRLSSRTKAYTNLDREKSHIVNTAWAMLALMKAGQVERDPTPLHKAARLIMSMQLGNGDFPQEEMIGSFLKNGPLCYMAYRNIFPIWALGEYQKLVLQCDLRRPTF